MTAPIALGISAALALWPAAALVWLRGSAAFGLNPVFSNHMMELTPPRLRATVSSLASMTWTMGWAAGAQVAGVIMERGNYMSPYWLSSALYASMAVSYFAFFGNRHHAGQRDGAPITRARIQRIADGRR